MKWTSCLLRIIIDQRNRIYKTNNFTYIDQRHLKPLNIRLSFKDIWKNNQQQTLTTSTSEFVVRPVLHYRPYHPVCICYAKVLLSCNLELLQQFHLIIIIWNFRFRYCFRSMSLYNDSVKIKQKNFGYLYQIVQIKKNLPLTQEMKRYQNKTTTKRINHKQGR